MPPHTIDPLALALPAKPRSGWLGRAVYLVACLGALVLASYLTALKLTGQISDLAGCGGEGGCANILGGQWANWFRLPISLWAIAVYVPLLLLGISGLTNPRRRRLALVGTSILVAAAAWFLFVQAVIEGQFCLYCCALHTCGVIAFGYALSRVWVSDLQERAASFLSAGGIASLTMVALIAGQCFGPQPPTHEITVENGLAAEAPQQAASPVQPGVPVPPNATAPEDASTAASPHEPTAAAPTAAESMVSPPAAADVDPLAVATGDRVVSYFDGAIVMPLDKVPLIGRPDARHVLLKYFDYTCPSCRRLHADLQTAIATYPNDLAVIVIPCPLNHACNPYADQATPERTGPESHEYACELARLALKVYRVAPSKFEAFHDELFTRQGRMTPQAAELIAEAAIGPAELRSTAEDAWIDALLKHSTGIYGRMKRGNPRMPKLLLGGRKVLHGVVTDSKAFLSLLRQQFQLDPVRAVE